MSSGPSRLPSPSGRSVAGQSVAGRSPSGRTVDTAPVWNSSRNPLRHSMITASVETALTCGDAPKGYGPRPTPRGARSPRTELSLCKILGVVIRLNRWSGLRRPHGSRRNCKALITQYFLGPSPSPYAGGLSRHLGTGPNKALHLLLGRIGDALSATEQPSTGGGNHGSANAISAAIQFLKGHGLNDDEAILLETCLPDGTTALMLYGSRARGDHEQHSDFDLLRLSIDPHSTFTLGRVSISSYTEEQLRGADHTLFGTHLLRDGQIILDTDEVLKKLMAALQPADPVELLSTVRRYSIVLSQPPEDQAEYCSGLVRLARYLLRTAIYAEAMRDGRPCFSVRELAARFDDPSLATILASDPKVTGPPTPALLRELAARLTNAVGPLPSNPFGSLAAMAVGLWDSDRNTASLAVRAMSEDAGTLDYSDLPKILL